MELAKNLALVAEGEKAIAISPLLVLNREFRVLVLDGEVKILFEKRRQADIWHHNLRLGAKPVAVTDTTLAAQLHSLALNVMSTLQARIGAVDIVETPTGLAVMEVNGGIMLNHFGAHSADNQAVAKNVYQEIITKSMQ
jgi:glutathione synthase/RimK-type ligase-like ATP-grasp enzyme